MAMQPAMPSDPVVRPSPTPSTPSTPTDREGFMALLAPGAAMADDGSGRDLADWIDRGGSRGPTPGRRRKAQA
ncbi:hypothetical protein [Streptomyces spinosus]|uniref:hypothetical protein n=1 Tax=Streptomyces spinosus TaxID=2872623 RepID=UPI001CEDC0D9|nr:hypothetical protein [Streptomyces spinosus]